MSQRPQPSEPKISAPKISPPTLSHLRESHAANPLFHNILQASSCESIFCGISKPYRSANHNEINILQTAREKQAATQINHNSLFRNILRIKSLESIFCGLKKGYESANHQKNQYFTETDMKKKQYPAGTLETRRII